MRPSNEAEADQLDLARRQGQAYAAALRAMADEDGIARTRAGDYLVAFTNEHAEGMYAYDGGELAWAEPGPQANTHLEVAVADGGDGRFVPELDVTVAVLDGERELLSTRLPFLWHPFLYHYGGNAHLPGEGPYNVRVRIEPPTFMRHDPVNGKRYMEPVEVTFEGIRFTLGVKPSPQAQPRGAAAPTAGT
jgi:hypothetical protein